MTKAVFDYPTLYHSAGRLSDSSQKSYLRLIRAEYAGLILAAMMALDISKQPAFYAAYAFIFIIALGVLVARNWLKPEQDWYKGRALAESIKTSCWRYAMGAEPFALTDNPDFTRAEFRNHLRSILDANRHIGDKIPPDHAANDQITASMEATRQMPLEYRKGIYDEFRIREQRRWYAKRSGENRSASKKWVALGVAIYLLAIGLSIFRIAFSGIEIWPIEPLIVVASSVIGWTQVKKFNELASSYTLTAYEIGIAQGRIAEITTDGELSTFVNETEQAFSREHTQWVARQQSQ